MGGCFAQEQRNAPGAPRRGRLRPGGDGGGGGDADASTQLPRGALTALLARVAAAPNWYELRAALLRGSPGAQAAAVAHSPELLLGVVRRLAVVVGYRVSAAEGADLCAWLQPWLLQHSPALRRMGPRDLSLVAHALAKLQGRMVAGEHGGAAGQRQQGGAGGGAHGQGAAGRPLMSRQVAVEWFAAAQPHLLACTFPARDISTSLWAASKLRLQALLPPAALQLLVAAAEPQLQRCNPQDLAMIALALAAMRPPAAQPAAFAPDAAAAAAAASSAGAGAAGPGLPPPAASWQAAFVARCAAVLPGCGPQALANLLHGAVHAGVALPPWLLGDFCAAAYGQLPAFTPQALANTLSALAAARHRPPPDWAERFFVESAARMGPGAGQRQGQGQGGAEADPGWDAAAGAGAAAGRQEHSGELGGASSSEHQHGRGNGGGGAWGGAGGWCGAEDLAHLAMAAARLGLHPPAWWCAALLAAAERELRSQRCSAMQLAQLLQGVVLLHRAAQARADALRQRYGRGGGVPGAGAVGGGSGGPDEEAEGAGARAPGQGASHGPGVAAAGRDGGDGGEGQGRAPDPDRRWPGLDAVPLAVAAAEAAEAATRPQPSLLHAWHDAAAARLPSFNPTDAAYSLWAHAALGEAPPGAWLRGLLLQVRPALPGMHPATLALLLWALAALRFRPTWSWIRDALDVTTPPLAPAPPPEHGPGARGAEDAAQREAAELLEVRRRREQHAHSVAQLQRLSPRDAAVLCSALVGLGARPSGAWVSALLESLQPRLGGLGLRCLAQTAWALYRLRVQPPPQWLEACVEAACREYGEVAAAAAARNGPAAAWNGLGRLQDEQLRQHELELDEQDEGEELAAQGGAGLGEQAAGAVGLGAELAGGAPGRGALRQSVLLLWVLSRWLGAQRARGSAGRGLRAGSLRRQRPRVRLQYGAASSTPAQPPPLPEQAEVVVVPSLPAPWAAPPGPPLNGDVAAAEGHAAEVTARANGAASVKPADRLVRPAPRAAAAVAAAASRAAPPAPRPAASTPAVAPPAAAAPPVPSTPAPACRLSGRVLRRRRAAAAAARDGRPALHLAAALRGDQAAAALLRDQLAARLFGSALPAVGPLMRAATGQDAAMLLAAARTLPVAASRAAGARQRAGWGCAVLAAARPALRALPLQGLHAVLAGAAAAGARPDARLAADCVRAALPHLLAAQLPAGPRVALLRALCDLLRDHPALRAVAVGRTLAALQRAGEAREGLLALQVERLRAAVRLRRLAATGAVARSRQAAAHIDRLLRQPLLPPADGQDGAQLPGADARALLARAGAVHAAVAAAVGPERRLPLLQRQTRAWIGGRAARTVRGVVLEGSPVLVLQAVQLLAEQCPGGVQASAQREGRLGSRQEHSAEQCGQQQQQQHLPLSGGVLLWLAGATGRWWRRMLPQHRAACVRSWQRVLAAWGQGTGEQEVLERRAVLERLPFRAAARGAGLGRAQGGQHVRAVR